MKRNLLFIFICISAFALFGCRNKDQATNFIPTPIVTPADEQAGDDTSDAAEASTDTTASSDNTTEDTEYVGKTTTKYVKLNNYNGVLNIRSTPANDGEVVGFLVHTEKVEVISIDNGWASFMYKGEKRYVSADFLVDKKPAYIAPPTLTPTPAATPTPKPGRITTAPEI